MKKQTSTADVSAHEKPIPKRPTKKAQVPVATADENAHEKPIPKRPSKKAQVPVDRCQNTIDFVPTVRAYLRVSTDKQDVENQRMGVSAYIVAKGFNAPVNYEDSESSKIDWKKRAVGKMLDESATGDIIIAAEVTRLARSTLEVLQIMETAASKGLIVHIVKNNLIMDGSMSSKIISTMLGLAGEIEREFITARTLESLQRRKQQLAQDGFFITRQGRRATSLGRPLGEADTLSLDAQAADIDKYLAKGLAKRSIAKLVDCAPTTLYDWLARRRPEIFSREKKKCD